MANKLAAQVSEQGRRLYESNTRRDTPGAQFEWIGPRQCLTRNTINGTTYTVDVYVWDNGSFYFAHELSDEQSEWSTSLRG